MHRPCPDANPLPPSPLPALGTQRTLTSFHFGTAGTGEKAYIQASLHADELPGMLVAHHLRGFAGSGRSARRAVRARWCWCRWPTPSA